LEYLNLYNTGHNRFLW